jgi:GTP-binding protein Era
VLSRPEGQVAFVDTPGIHSSKGALNRYMVDVALAALSEVDLVLYLVEARTARVTAVDDGNRFILERLVQQRRPALLALNKVDAIAKPLLLPLIDLYHREYDFKEIIPISARTGEGVDELLGAVLSHLPEGPPLFPAETVTDQTERGLVAEYVREQVLEHTRQELPYSTAVVVDVFDESDRHVGRSGLIRIAATLYVERESQKAIVIGKRGQMLKAIGAAARLESEKLLGAHVYLSLRVKVERDWSERADGLKKMGYA